VKVSPGQPDLAELLRRLNAPPVATAPRGVVEVVPVPKPDPGKAVLLPNPGVALPNPGVALPNPGIAPPKLGVAPPKLGATLPSSPQSANGFTATPKLQLQLLLDAAGGNPMAQPSLQQDPLSFQELATSAEQEPRIWRAADHGAGGEKQQLRAEPQRITEQFWHSEVRPSLEARRELMSRLDEQGGSPLLVQHPQVRSELGMPPGVQLLAALQAGLQTAPGTSAARVATTPSEPDGKSKSKRTAHGDFPSLSAERMRRRSYLIAATMAALMAVFAAAKSCSVF
jgi:hypothetical protein